jgi:phage shock protein A
VDSLTAENQQLRGQVSQLEQRVADLERQVSQAYALAAGVGIVLAAAGFAAGYFIAKRKAATG